MSAPAAASSPGSAGADSAPADGKEAPPQSPSPGARLRWSRLRPNSLRAQLALWHGGLLALTLLLLALFTYILLRQVLNSAADATLETYAETTAKTIAAQLYQHQTISPHQPIDASRFVNNNELQSWGRYVQVIDPQGVKVAASDALRTLSLPDTPQTRLRALQGEPAIFETHTGLGEYPIRMVTVPVQMGEKIPYLIQVAASVEGVEAALQRAAMILLVLTPSVLLIAFLGGWWLVGRALRPVDAMTQTALSIESKKLDVRLIPPQTDNEIGRLASAFNEMIARLDKSFRQIERFTADASHELKTPLTSIRGEAEVALMGDLPPDETRKTFRSIIEETERLTSIVNNLLLLSRADAEQVRLKQEPVELHEIALAAYEPMERLARRKNITLDIAELEPVTVRGDALWLQQLMTNLLHNAIHYTPENGSVTLSLTHERGLDTPGAPGFACFIVQDTGPGIPPEHLPHLFDRFYRVDSGRSRDQGGSGLGLNIVRWIAESHGGNVSVVSAVGKGTTFTARFPASPESEPEAAGA